MTASANVALDVVFLVAAIMGPVVAIAIFWFGLRSARKHDERNRS